MRWELTTPQVTYAVKQGLDSLVNTLRTLRADDVPTLPTWPPMVSNSRPIVPS
jgi:hypothetical protein